MSRLRFLAAILLAAASGLLSVARASEDEVGRLHVVLQSEAPLHQKVVACKRLAVVGTRQSIPILAKLLDDRQLAHYARFGLEAIPDPAVDRTFRKALTQLQGVQLVGVINSIGARKDVEAVGQLHKLLADEDAATVSAASAALGRIANQQAIAILLQRLDTGSGVAQAAIADACLAATQELIARDERNQALELYNAVRRADLPKRFRVAATYSAIRMGDSAAVPLLREQLKSDDDALFAVALQAARDLRGEQATQVLLAELDTNQPPRKALMIAALGERGDKAALPAVRQAANAESQVVKIAAIRALQRLEDVAAAEMLLAIAGGSGRSAEAAGRALERLPGKRVNDAIMGHLKTATPKNRALLIQLIGHRRMQAAVPDLLAAASAPDKSIRMAAIKALGETIEFEDLQKLVEKVLSAPTADESAAARAALTAACVRIPDREACVEKLVALFSRAPIESRVFLFELLREVGGTAALKIIVAKARDRNDAVQDAATRVLGEWLTVDAAPELLKLSTTLTANKYKIRALRGYIRIIRQFGLPVEQRVEMSRAALRASQRPDEKILVLQALSRFPSPQSLSLAVEQLSSPGLKATAARTAVGIAERLGAEHATSTRDAMQRVLDARVVGLEGRVKIILQRNEPKP